MYKKSLPDARVNAARIREHIGHSLRNYYQACMSNKSPPRLLTALKKLDEEKTELSSEDNCSTFIET